MHAGSREYDGWARLMWEIGMCVKMLARLHTDFFVFKHAGDIEMCARGSPITCQTMSLRMTNMWAATAAFFRAFVFSFLSVYFFPSEVHVCHRAQENVRARYSCDAICRRVNMCSRFLFPPFTDGREKKAVASCNCLCLSEHAEIK